jgi:hypothetical protein
MKQQALRSVKNILPCAVYFKENSPGKPGLFLCGNFVVA